MQPASPAAERRRRHRRVAIDAPVRVSTIDPELDPRTGRPFFRAFEDRCLDLSPGGLRLRTHEILAPGRRVLLEVELPEGPRFEAIARVAWTAHAGPEHQDVGVEFLGNAPEQLTGLERYLGAAGWSRRAP